MTRYGSTEGTKGSSGTEATVGAAGTPRPQCPSGGSRCLSLLTRVAVFFACEVYGVADNEGGNDCNHCDGLEQFS
jgi:hypothetical protein